MLFNATSKDLIITLSFPLIFDVPIPITGFGPAVTVEIDDFSDVTTNVGADGNTSYSLIPQRVRGRFRLQYLSEGAAAIRQVQAKKQLGILIPGKMIITSPSGQHTTSYQEFIIESG